MIENPVFYNAEEGYLEGQGVSQAVRCIKDLKGVFADDVAWNLMDSDKAVYQVEVHDRCGEIEGGLLFGISLLYPGKVGNEYFMTKGHFHKKLDRGEYYWGIQGAGLLVLMDEERRTWTEKVFKGSLHYITGHVAHRLVNVGEEKLIVGACWPSDAGHDYESIQRDGFGIRVFEQNGQAVLIEQMLENIVD
ncbi:MAG: glucose-6-phosphate isomerase [Gorillibacterium sp.]|nr:glucose-6-phosphate isomerase [Gorillibacterium sp.]